MPNRTGGQRKRKSKEEAREGQAPQTDNHSVPAHAPVPLAKCPGSQDSESSREQQGEATLPPNQEQHKQARGRQVPDPGPVITQIG